MAEFCLKCFNEMNGTHYSEEKVWLEDDFCEGCGEWKPCVYRLYPKPPKPLYRKILDKLKTIFKKEEKLSKIDEAARMIGADVYSDLPNVEIDPNDITPEELFRTWAVAKGFMEIRKEPTPERIELMQKERRGEITVEEIKEILRDMEVEELCSLTPDEVIERYKDYEPEEPLPPFDVFMKKVEARQKALQEAEEGKAKGKGPQQGIGRPEGQN